MKKFIVIIYKVDTNEQLVKDTIKTLGAWFNYIPGSFLLLTTYTVQEIYNKISTNKSEDSFLLMEIDLKSYCGILPKDAWTWIQEKSEQQKRGI